MGCDIHAYIEHAADDRRIGDGSLWWQDFGGRINPGRDYDLFGHLAGVRCNGVTPVAPVRGYPEDAALAADEDNFVRIHYGEEDLAEEGECTPETATKWHNSYGAPYKPHEEGTPPKFIQSPDWHTHSWVTPDEFELAIQRAETDHRVELAAMKERYVQEGLPIPEYLTDPLPDRSVSSRYYAVLAAMRALEGPGRHVRLVFWFDN